MFRPLTDDRGREIRFTTAFKADVSDDEAEHDEDLWDQGLDGRHDFVGSLLPGLVVLGVIVAGILLKLPGWLVFVLAGLVIIGLVILLQRSMLTPFFCSRAYECIQQAVRRGRCAACGYVLADLAEDDDGMIACPVCGAAWRGNRLRAVVAPGDAVDREVIRGHLGAVLQLPRATPYLDHRGRPASLVLYRPARNPIDDYAARCYRAAELIYTPVSGKGTWMSAALIAVGIGFFLFMLWYGALDPLGTPRWVYALIPAMVLALFAGFLLRRGDLLVKRATIEHATLAQGLCPSCWELLEGIPPDTDGCTMCPECGSSWRVPPPVCRPCPEGAPACSHG